MSRVYNFSAGPAVLPEEVLQEAAAEMMDYKGTGMSVMEMSHRSKAYQAIIDEAEADLRELMNIPANYKVLFLQGGASQQFAMIPMNLMKNGVADYIITGQWAKKAYQEAQMYGKANAVASSADKIFSLPLCCLNENFFIQATCGIDGKCNSTDFGIYHFLHNDSHFGIICGNSVGGKVG